ncbi:chalcone isomerase family protein [Pseudoalteromonas sp. T1lg23B]|uniref:chalcone isomerase family protein n=1 Tax=Pseudoalteromonas sp. T1lg23B TaxID=2077097 RepID=UPI000CF67B05|nr:chalcone isomerase family protein [Pseudoalteromonas sp. T1lg23B]
MIRRLFVCLYLATSMAYASVAQQLIPGAKAVGDSPTLSYLFWDIYQATLYAPNGQFDSNSPFVLKLHYLRALEGEEIAKRSIEEMQKQGLQNEALLSSWLKQMQAIFPDVTNGTELYGQRTEQGSSRFYNGNTLIGEIDDPQFTKYFFAIWLSENTTEPAMRKALLNIN